MARLLVLVCSATKRPGPDSIPALARYAGPLWRTLRAADPDGCRNFEAVPPPPVP